MYTPKFLANKPIELHFSSGTDENGSEKITNVVFTKARIEESNEIVYLPDGTKANIQQKLFIFEELSKFPILIRGFCFIDGVQYTIAKSGRYMNPDGSINHFVLGLI